MSRKHAPKGALKGLHLSPRDGRMQRAPHGRERSEGVARGGVVAPEDTLGPFLEFAVPVEMQNQAALSHSIRRLIAQEAAPVVAEKADVIQFRGRGTGVATAALVRGLAALAHQPGGVTFMGRHWCVDHATCKRTKGATK